MIVERVEQQTVYVTLPGPEAGLTKVQILETFVRELCDGLDPSAVLGQVIRLNGRMTTEMAMAVGAVAARLGARGVELYDPAQDRYVAVLGEGAPLPMPVQLLPGMVVEVTGGSLFRPGARAVVVNVGRESVNIAAEGRGRRETGWTDIKNVRPVGWETPPRIIRPW